MVPPFPVLRHDISWWTNFELPTMSGSLSCNIAPQIAFMTYSPGSGEMVDFLIRIHALESRAPDRAGPQAVPAATFRDDPEARDLEGVHHAVVGVS